MKRTLYDWIRLLVLLLACSVLLYPALSNYFFEKNSAKLISAYDAQTVKLHEADKERMLSEARAYNGELLWNAELLDPFSTKRKENDERYERLLDVNGSGMMGYLVIPKTEARLPVYHGTHETVLQTGIGHFEGTSLPIGGEGTHAVLTGHRGLPSKRLFTDLDELEEGDSFYIRILGETLAYEVDQILTVLPEETEALGIVPEKDYVTLVTCTPYAVNTHRLLVRGHRIPYEETKEMTADDTAPVRLPLYALLLLCLEAVLLLGFLGARVRKLWKRWRKRWRKTGAKREGRPGKEERGK